MTRPATGWPESLERDVRANPGYRLVERASLATGYARSLERAGADLSHVFGMLIGDRSQGLADKVVDRAGAELFTEMRQPGRVSPAAAARLAELIFDGVFEVETADGFVSGPLAYEQIAERDGCDDLPLDRLGRLSYAGLAYAERLQLTDVARLTARLYYYNRVPLTGRWTRAYPDAKAVQALLAGPALSQEWIGGHSSDGEPVNWLSWIRRDDSSLRVRSDELPYKLYVSPAVDALPEVLPVLAETLRDAGAKLFKVGPDAPGLLRPDKIVVYMSDAEELSRVARGLKRDLAGISAHGVPFTAQLADDGLLSWGGDPPVEAGPLGEGIESWRLSVSRRLAEYIAAAQRASLRRIRPFEFALARLAISGVDVHSFAPAELAPPSLGEGAA